jgi:hypothetical protein
VIFVVTPAIAVTGVWPIEIARRWPEASVVLLRGLPRRQCITEPGSPFFSDPDAGSMTERGRVALRR